MRAPDHPPDAELTPPACRATVAGIQRALDGQPAADALDADPHAGACVSCRARLRAARVLLAVLATPAEQASARAGFADRVLDAVQADRRAGVFRRRLTGAAGAFALAAAVLVAAFAVVGPTPAPGPLPPRETAKPVEVVPEPRPNPVPEPRPIRVGDEFARATQALRDVPKPLTDSVAVAPKLFDALSDPFTGPVPGPMGALEPARKSLSDLPDAARTGLAPVTGTTQKAFDKFLRDVASFTPKS